MSSPAYFAERRRQRLADGLCGECAQERERADVTRCDACIARSSKAQSAKRKLGICRTCSRRAIKGHAYCQTHQAYFARYRREH